tara:strand:- start:73 stop:543 length:471 start_codon:yes stop_codon:yes gene_type:complete
VKFLFALFILLSSSANAALPNHLYGSWEGLRTETGHHFQTVLVLNESGNHLYAQESLGNRNVFSFRDEDIIEHEGFLEISLTRILEGRFSLDELTLSVMGFKLIVVPGFKTGPLYVTYSMYGKAEPFSWATQSTLLKSEKPILSMFNAIEKYLEDE